MTSRGRIAVIGAGPAGMAAALATHRAGFTVALFERHTNATPNGGILILSPAPQKILNLLGVDTTDLGAPYHLAYTRADGHIRASHPAAGIGLLPRGLHDRMRAALPEALLRPGHECTAIRDRGDDVVLSFAEHPNFVADIVIGADGLRSLTRRALSGPEPIRNQALHRISGYLLEDSPPQTEAVIAHSRTTEFGYTPLRHEGQSGTQWWLIESCQPNDPPPPDLQAFCAARAKSFSPLVQNLIARTPPAQLQRSEIRDRPPRRQWSKGRVTLAGDAAHPTAALQAATLAIEDGDALAHALAACRITDTADVRRALQAYETSRKPPTAKTSQQAYRLGKIFHHTPLALRPLRDILLDQTPLLQKFTAAPPHAAIEAPLDPPRPLP